VQIAAVEYDEPRRPFRRNASTFSRDPGDVDRGVVTSKALIHSSWSK
jgi:hypothetical protein